MLRFVVRRKQKDSLVSGAEWETLETIDVDLPELERRLEQGGFGDSGYDVTELVGVEVLPKDATR